MKLEHRADIDGLRALAVLPVVFHHAHLPGLPGGFVGVDVFFVISGFLITGILLKELQAGRFTLASFYERRIRRIVPALFVVILATLLVLPLVSLPPQMQETSASALAAIFSVSNIWFWQQSGYFSPAVQHMPLLHTWSLGVEEQFYLLFPLLLMLCWRRQWPLRRLLLLGMVPLLALGVGLSYWKTSAAFYLLPARAWELGLGALLACGAVPALRHGGLRTAAATLGLALIAGAVLFLDAGMVFPGWLALLPCMGTALILHAAPGTWVGRLLSMRPLVFVGLISYSLYLWHWPVLSLASIHAASLQLDTPRALAAVALSFGLAVLSWKYVELPFRNRGALPGRRMAQVLAPGLAALVGLSVFGVLSGGLPQRLGPEATQLLSAVEDVDPIRGRCSRFAGAGRGAECRFGPEGRPVSYAVVGDSHAAALRGAFQHVAPFDAQAGTLWWFRACPFLVGARRVTGTDFGPCAAFKQRALAALKASPEITDVILAARWGPSLTGHGLEIGGAHRNYFADDQTTALSAEENERVFERAVARTVDTLTALGKRVVIVGGVQEPGFDVPRLLALAAFNGRPEATVVSRDKVMQSQRRADEIFRSIAATRPGVRYVPVWDAFCDKDCALMADGVPLYYDDDHITFRAASTLMASAIEARLREGAEAR